MRINWQATILLSIFISLSTLVSSFSLANPVIPVSVKPEQPSFIPSAPTLTATAYILLDAKTGKILAEKDADKRLPPASLTKLMSMYIISSALKNGSIKLDDKVQISKKAWQMEGSRMFVKVGDEVPVKDLIRGIVVASGNDATVAMAEHVAGSEESFKDMMNQQAQLIGMKNSHFTDSTGLPNPDHYTTAHDLALLTQAYIKNFPEDYAIYSEKWVEYNHIRQPNRNRLLWRYPSADGLKTGHTQEAGYCLVGSAEKNGMRLVTVVLGTPSDLARTEDSARLLTYGFRFYETRKIYHADEALAAARIWKGQIKNTQVGLLNDLYVTIPAGQFKKLQASIHLNAPIEAPVSLGQPIGQLNLILNNKVIESYPIVALKEVKKGGIWRRFVDTIGYAYNKHFSTKQNDTISNS